MKKPKRADRWERMALSRAKSNFGDSYTVSLVDTAALLRREHRAIVRMVKNADKYRQGVYVMVQSSNGQWLDRKDILAKLKARGQ